MTAAQPFHEKVGRILVGQGLLTEESLQRALGEKERPGAPRTWSAHFADVANLHERDVLKAIGVQTNLSVVDLADVVVDAPALALVTEAQARQHNILPLYLVEKELTVAIPDPKALALCDFLEKQTRCKVNPVLALDRDIAAGIEVNYRGASRPVAAEESVSAAEVKRLEQAGKELPVVKLVDEILMKAMGEGASDIHFEPREHGVTVRFRVDGGLREYYAFTKKQYPGIVSRIKIISELDISEHGKPQDGRLRLVVAGRTLDARVSIVPAFYGERVVMRLLDSQRAQLGLDELNIGAHNLARLQTAAAQPYGMLLVTGPTGSGKSTTLYALLNEMKSETKNILTVEDPVEYQIPLISQVQVNVKKGLTFASALRSFLRQDPNVIMVGEIRDQETAQIATEAALTGHLVLSTLHTNDSPSAITRLIEMGIEPFLLGPSLLGVVAQRLARRICPDCRVEHEPSATALAACGLAGEDGEAAEGVVFYSSSGCGKCRGTGFKGRVGLHELLLVDDTIRSLISEHASADRIRAAAEANGFVNMRSDGLLKAAQGLTSVEEVLRVTRS